MNQKKIKLCERNYKKQASYFASRSRKKTLSALSNVLEAPYQIYNRAKLADMDFGTFQ